MLRPPWIALNRGAIVEPLLVHQKPHPSREAGSFFGQLPPDRIAPVPTSGTVSPKRSFVGTTANGSGGNRTLRSYGRWPDLFANSLSTAVQSPA